MTSKYSKMYDFDVSDGEENDENVSNEDTEDASEGEESKSEEVTEIKEQMYQDKLEQLKKQLGQLHDHTLPEYLKKYKRIEQHYRERLRLNTVWKDYEIERVTREYNKQTENVIIEFEEKKAGLKESLLQEFEEKKKVIENEYITMELSGDTTEVKAVSTRKLRRRQTDPIPLPDKRRKASPLQLNFFLDDDEIMEDLRMISKISGKPLQRKIPATGSTNHKLPTTGSTNHNSYSEITFEAKIDDGKLYYDKRWFSRGQPIYVESKDLGKFPAVISAVSMQDVYVRKCSDSNRIRIQLTQLQKGKFIVKRRSE